MARVIFEDEGKEVEVADGSRVQDAVTEVDADIPFGCREGECATCIVEVLSGMENLSEYSENELLTLTDEERAANIRLTCQISITSGDVTLRPAEEIF